jgi:hypothetical protein
VRAYEVSGERQPVLTVNRASQDCRAVRVNRINFVKLANVDIEALDSQDFADPNCHLFG